MVVCKFFLSGNCRYGANCRFEHPQNTGGQSTSQNRFAPLSGQNGRPNDAARKDLPWSINITDVKNDMTSGQGRPQWILSTYGPGRAPPASLLENNEYSFEELRQRFYELAAAGNEAQANQEAGALWSKAEEGMRSIAQNADEVVRFMEDADKKHPNRYDFCQTDGTKAREEVAKAAESANTSFGGGLVQATAAFGQPSFGQSATNTGFGQPSQPVLSANPFAQPSAATGFGKPTFGQPAAGTGFGQGGFGQPSQPAGGFGQSSQLAQSANPFAQPATAFGQPALPSGFGQPAQKTPAFGQPSQPTSGFGQPSQPAPAFGQPSQPAQSANPFAKPAVGFGQPSQPVSGFGQPATTFGKPVATGGFGQSGFGQPSQPVAPGFGQPTQNFTGGFGQPSQPAATGPSQPSQPAANGFGAGAGFGANSGSASPFGQPKAATAAGGFGQPSNPPATTPFGRPSNNPASNGFGNAPAASTGFGSTPNAQSAQTSHPLTGQPPAALHYTETMPKRATTFRPGTNDVSQYAGRRVQYVNDAPCYERPDGKGLERVWFPEFANGTDVQALTAPGKKDDLESKAEDYTDSVNQAYVHLFTKGEFGEVGMPMVPPLREWCAFDF